MTGEREREKLREEYDTQNRERSSEKIVTSLMVVGNRVKMSVGHRNGSGKPQKAYMYTAHMRVEGEGGFCEKLKPGKFFFNVCRC